MNEQQIKLTIGALLHSIGADVLIHSQGIGDKDILDCIQYSSEGDICSAELAENSPAYIVYAADKIASSKNMSVAVRNAYESSGDVLEPVFNILNGNHKKMYYQPDRFDVEKQINWPVEKKTTMPDELRAELVCKIAEQVDSITFTDEYANALLEAMESNLSYIASKADLDEIGDISIFDHAKLTAAVSSCIYSWLEENLITDWKKCLIEEEKTFASTNAFLLVSLDISGIQTFIYTITAKNALRTLRARSFYLEILMEHIIDELLKTVGISRANLIYAGGGHCYMLLPDTQRVKEGLKEYLRTLNEWCLIYFQTSLFVAGAWAEISADTMKNKPEGSYANAFRTVSSKLSEQKLRRYTSAQINALNAAVPEDDTRECSVCRNIGRINKEGLCPVCSAMKELSRYILYSDYFAVDRKDGEMSGVPLPGKCVLRACDEAELIERVKAGSSPLKIYSKNKSGSSFSSTRLYVGSYTSGDTFAEFAEKAKGISRIGVLRADIDNLGQTFVAGLKNKDNHDRYVTMTRTAVLSRQLSLFFKLHINKLLASPEFTLSGDKKDKRNASIVYSGGDDVFIVGAWDDIVEFSVDLRNSLKRYSEGALTISGGIGIYTDSYPIHAIAGEVASMEDRSKDLPGKDAITIFDNQTYHWDAFEKAVLGDKFGTVSAFFDKDDTLGKSFLYNLLVLIRNQDEKINFARCIYLLARMEPDDTEPDRKAKYEEFRTKILQWLSDKEDIRELITAIEIYVYYTRQEEERQ